MRDEDLFFIKNDPLVKKLESDPRYQAFLRKMNFPNEHGEVTAQKQLDVGAQLSPRLYANETSPRAAQQGSGIRGPSQQ
jgi:hypothetical protein